MKATIWHCENTRDSFSYARDGKWFNLHKAFQTFLDGDYTKVATIEAASLNDAYARSQNIEENWNPSNPCRSTSVGDIIEFDDKFFIVACVGFEELDFDEYFSFQRQRYLELKSKKG